MREFLTKLATAVLPSLLLICSQLKKFHVVFLAQGKKKNVRFTWCTSLVEVTNRLATSLSIFCFISSFISVKSYFFKVKSWETETTKLYYSFCDSFMPWQCHLLCTVWALPGCVFLQAGLAWVSVCEQYRGVYSSRQGWPGWACVSVRRMLDWAWSREDFVFRDLIACFSHIRRLGGTAYCW